MRPGPRNLITDVDGILVGNAHDPALRTGSTVLTSDAPFTASVHVMGGAPGSRETDLLAPENTVPGVDAFVLSGGSAFGLDAASGVTEALRKAGVGFVADGHNVPIVPAAIIFDLSSGGDKTWDQNPYGELGRTAVGTLTADFALGTAGAGTGATAGGLKGGIGSASVVLDDGIIVGALVAVNARGSVLSGASGQFWAAPFEQDGEFGGRGICTDPAPAPTFSKGSPREATTIGIVATNADISKADAKRIAVAAHDGYARSIIPAHTPFDGDLIFSLATKEVPVADGPMGIARIGHAAAVATARAVARGVYEATSRPTDRLPTWADQFGSGG